MNYQKLQALAVAGNVVVDFTPPTNQAYRVLYGHSVIACDGTAADRRFKFTLYDENSKIVIDAHTGAVVTAGLTRHIAMKQGIYRETTFIDADIELPIPKDFIIPQGYTLRCEIEAGVAGDVWEVSLAVEQNSISAF